MVKTIQGLNEKIFHRLLKVIYGAFLLSIIIISVIAVFKNNIPNRIVDVEKSYILCNDSSKISLSMMGTISWMELGVQLPGYKYWEFQKFCNDKNYVLQARDNIQIPSVKELMELGQREKNYDLYINYKKDKSWFVPFFYSFLVLLVIRIIYEVIKRLFYYIVFHTIKPPKS